MRIPKIGRLGAWLRRRSKDAPFDAKQQINDALQRMKENQIRNRRVAVQATTDKNTIANLYGHQRSKLARIRRAQRTAKKEGNREERGLLDGPIREEYNRMRKLQANYRAAEEKAGRIKVAIRNEEATFRRAVGRALALKVLIQAEAAEAAYFEQAFPRDARVARSLARTRGAGARHPARSCSQGRSVERDRGPSAR